VVIKCQANESCGDIKKLLLFSIVAPSQSEECSSSKSLTRQSKWLGRRMTSGKEHKFVGRSVCNTSISNGVEKKKTALIM